MKYDPMGRIKRVSPGVMLPPGQCICGTSSGEVFAQLDMSIEWYGELYLCEACTRGAASVFGLLFSGNEEELRNRIAELEASNKKYTKENEQLGKLNESLRDALDDASRRLWEFNNPSTSTTSSSADEQAIQPKTEPVQFINSEPVFDHREDERESDESEPVLDGETGNDKPEDNDDGLAGLRAAVALADRSLSEQDSGEDSVGREPSGLLFGES